MGAKRGYTGAVDETPASGLYDLVLTEVLATRLSRAQTAVRASHEAMEPAESPRRLADRFAEVLREALQTLHEKKVAPLEQAQICNRLLLHLSGLLVAHDLGEAVDIEDLLKPELLLEVTPRTSLAAHGASVRPSLPLSQTHLLVNARGEHSVGSEIAREIESADSIDLLCSFLLWSGYQRLKPALLRFLQRKSTRLRVITTVYMGATDARVLDELHASGAEIRISFDTKRTRLHAKAWLLHRATGFTTGYIGSSNLSAAALTDGLEWNVRVGRDAADVLDKFAATFEGYWNEPSFEPYDPAADGTRLRDALAGATARGPASTLLLDVRPYPYQEAMLERLESERFEYGRMRNLVVAATGTGKTVVAALDYARLSTRFRTEHGRRPALLFVAHRAEILEQARSTFRSVLGDSTFGSLLVGGSQPTAEDALFASVQSLAQRDPSQIPKDRWDVVIVDEFHHAAAPTYRRWLDHLSPWVLLGLTATPERADGEDILAWFGGRAAADLRLWDAIDQGLLAPFQYFGLKDALDTSSYWKRGRIDVAELDGVLSAHDVRARQVLDATREHVADVSQMRALGFCVGRQHAQFMARYFTERGIPSATALGDDVAERQERIDQLRQGKLRALFTVDALSEGVDIRELDTVLMLRPTESATVFLQQLGRGLRHFEGKRCLTVLDLVSIPAKEFRLDLPLRALVGGSRRHVEHEIEEGFPSLPPGCSIQLTDDARKTVVASLKSQLSTSARVLEAELRRLGPATTLGAFLDESRLSVDELCRRHTMTALRRAAGFEMPLEMPIEAVLDRTARRFISIDDHDVILALRTALSGGTPDFDLLRPALIVLTDESAYRNPESALAAIVQHEPARRELLELLAVAWDRGSLPSIAWSQGSARLRVHCRYTRDFITYALAGGREKPPVPPREGVWPVQENALDALFVTTNKSEKRYSPSTMYRDYAISRDLFHWQSQSTTTATGKRGQRHIRHAELGVTPLLFVRSDAEDDLGATAPYLFLGPVTCEAAEGEKPINITWRLRHTMPAEAFEALRVAR